MTDSPSPGGARDDLKLVEAMAAGDAGALSIFYDRHAPVVFATCVRMIGDRATAEELLIDIFQEFWTRAGQYDAARSNPLTYLLTLTRSRAIDRRRLVGKRSHLKPAGDTRANVTADNQPGALANLITNENVTKVRQALARLDVEQRRAIECAYFDGLSHTEIAELLNKPLGTIKTYIRQGLIRLRECLRNEDDEGSDSRSASTMEPQ